MSDTEVLGYRVRIIETSCAAPSELPPDEKKFAPSEAGPEPSTAAHCSASQPSRPENTTPAVSIDFNGHGSAARSTLPDVRVGSVSTTAINGTSAAGSSVRSCSTAAD